MMRLIRSISIALATATALCAAAATQPAARANPIGTWVNPRGSVRVATGNCAGGLCGWVIWANPAATRDARESGVQNLIGTALLRDYRPTGSGRWRGQVYVPDLGRSFVSTIQQLDPNSLRISGCILGGLICRSQIWRRA
jgi:uncharacterized protein (DUF2147 family)